MSWPRDLLQDERPGEDLTKAATDLIEVAILTGGARKKVRDRDGFRSLVRRAARARGVGVRTVESPTGVYAYIVDWTPETAAKVELSNEDLPERMNSYFRSEHHSE